MKITKQDCKNKHEINIDNYLMKKRIQKENMLKINTQICPKKIDRNSKIFVIRTKLLFMHNIKMS